ncbi:hypothetical protein P8452_26499 [Trifolium repens]|nr:hypothetical protein P8452_26499 [Trifolium repens]
MGCGDGVENVLSKTYEEKRVLGKLVMAKAIGSSYKGASSKPNDNERISTPSSIALSIAAIVSDTYAPSFHNTLYMIHHPRFLLNRFDLVITPRHDYYPLTPRAQRQLPWFLRRWVTPWEPPGRNVVGLSTVSAAWGIDLIIGPAIGGYLAQVVAHS